MGFGAQFSCFWAILFIYTLIVIGMELNMAFGLKSKSIRTMERISKNSSVLIKEYSPTSAEHPILISAYVGGIDKNFGSCRNLEARIAHTTMLVAAGLLEINLKVNTCYCKRENICYKQFKILKTVDAGTSRTIAGFR